MRNYKFIVLLIIIFISSCDYPLRNFSIEEEISLEVEGYEKELFFMGIFQEGQGGEAYLIIPGLPSHLGGPGGYNMVPDNVIITLTDHQGKEYPFTFTKNFHNLSLSGDSVYKEYHFNDSIDFVRDESYTVSVAAEGFDEVTGSFSIPKPIEITSGKQYSVTNSDGEFVHFEINFNDRSEEKNYFMLGFKNQKITDAFYRQQIFSISQQKFIDTLISIHGTQKYAVRIPMTDPVFDYLPKIRTDLIEHWSVDVHYNYKKIFTDDLFQDATYTLSFDLLTDKSIEEYLQQYTEGSTCISTATIYLYSLSESMYQYLLSDNLYGIVENDLYSENYYRYSNMSNGIGVAGGYSVDSISFDIDYIIKQHQPYDVYLDD